MEMPIGLLNTVKALFKVTTADPLCPGRFTESHHARVDQSVRCMFRESSHNGWAPKPLDGWASIEPPGFPRYDV